MQPETAAERRGHQRNLGDALAVLAERHADTAREILRELEARLAGEGAPPIERVREAREQVKLLLVAVLRLEGSLEGELAPAGPPRPGPLQVLRMAERAGVEAARVGERAGAGEQGSGPRRVAGFTAGGR